jgi:organic hydroperoxide reductase OsmC/OhrA
MTHLDHGFTARLVWEGNTGQGTADYAGYGRGFRIEVDGKPDLGGSAAPMFRGEAGRHNPEDLFLASLAACHMLFYLALCARHGLRVLAYQDEVRGVLSLRPDGGGRFETITLCPRVALAPGGDEALALQLHQVAHERCFIANSCGVAVRHTATISTASTGERTAR